MRNAAKVNGRRFGEKPGIIARPDHPRAESCIEVPDVVILGLRSFVRAGGANDVGFHVSSRDDLQADGHAIAGNSGAYRCRRLSGQIERVRVVDPRNQVPIRQLLRNVLSNCER